MTTCVRTYTYVHRRTTYDDKDFDRVTLEDDPEVAIVSGADGFGDRHGPGEKEETV